MSRLPLISENRDPAISFIIPLFNHLEQTRAMLSSLRASLHAGISHEIILIDDFSTDATREWLQTLDIPNCKVLLNSENLGYAATNNRAAQAATSGILAFLNNDLLFEKGWLEPMLALLANPALNAGLVGNLQYSMADATLDHAGIQVTPRGKIEHIRTPAQHTNYKPVFATTAACCLITKDDFEAATGFDEWYLNGGEDVDLCLKLRQAGKKIYVAANSSVRHHVSLSRDLQSEQNERNSRRIFSKWRREIKDELARVWLAMIQGSSEEMPEAYIDGMIEPELLKTPATLSLLIAENFLQHEECRWIRLLDNTDPEQGLAGRCSVRGIRNLPDKRGAFIEGSAELSIDCARSLRNFYVCGYRVAETSEQPITLTLGANSIQQKTVQLSLETNFNVGIVQPVTLPDRSNHFTVTAEFNDSETGVPLGNAGSSLVITHFVLDDQMIPLDGRDKCCKNELHEKDAGGARKQPTSSTDLIASYPLEQHLKFADEYFSGREGHLYLYQKPFHHTRNSADALSNLGQLLAGLQLDPGMRVLDFAAGSCWLSRILLQMGCQVTCCDASATALEIGKRLLEQHPPIAESIMPPEFVVFNGKRLPHQDETFDRVVVFDAFHHIPNTAAVLMELYRLLKPDGIVAMSEPGRCHSGSTDSQYEMNTFKVIEHDIVLEELWEEARQAGFRDIRVCPVLRDTYMDINQYCHCLNGDIPRPLLQRLAQDTFNHSIFFLHKTPVPAATHPAEKIYSQDQFDEAFYLERYPDIAAVVAQGRFTNGWQHYERHGRDEGRQGSR